MNKRMHLPCLFILTTVCLHAQPDSLATCGNPIVKGWYADPEAAVFEKKYWIYPTYSAPYGEQVLIDAFSSKDLITWTKHSRIIDTASVKWVKKAMWAPAIVQKGNKYFHYAGIYQPQCQGRSG